MKESKKEFQERVSTVSKDHFMLEFQKKCFDPLRKKNSNLHELRHYVDLGVSLQFLKTNGEIVWKELSENSQHNKINISYEAKRLSQFLLT